MYKVNQRESKSSWFHFYGRISRLHPFKFFKGCLPKFYLTSTLEYFVPYSPQKGMKIEKDYSYTYIILGDTEKHSAVWQKITSNPTFVIMELKIILVPGHWIFVVLRLLNIINKTMKHFINKKHLELQILAWNWGYIDYIQNKELCNNCLPDSQARSVIAHSKKVRLSSHISFVRPQLLNKICGVVANQLLVISHYILMQCCNDKLQ